MKKYKIIFVGLDHKVLELLVNSLDFQVIAANFIEDFINYKTYNIFNMLFKTVYRFRCFEKFYWIEHTFLEIYNLLFFLSSSIFNKYYNYLRNLSVYKIKIINFKNKQKVFDFIIRNEIDLIVVSNWWLLPDKIIYAPKFKTVNIHPSRLPQYRGSVPTLWSLKNKDKETAVTFMVINSVLDEGEVIAQHKVEISEKDDSLTLEEKCDNAIKKHLIKDLIKYLNGEIIPIKQDSSFMSLTAKYYDYMKINWKTESVRDIVNKIKLYPHLWPIDQCYGVFQEKKVLFKDAAILNKNHHNIPGSFIIKGLSLCVYGIDNVIIFRLFKDMSIRDSLILFFKRSGLLL